MKRALLLGAYGQTNLGDDLLMYNYLRYLTQHGYTQIDTNASEPGLVPAAITNTFPQVRLFSTYGTSFVHLLRLMLGADHIFYGGGTVYKELYATTGRSRYSVILPIMLFNMAARLAGKKVTGLHLGIGTIKTPIGRWITRMVLCCQHTTFRDRESFIYARDVLHVPAQIIGQSTDGFFLDERWRSPWQQVQVQKPAGAKQIVGINMLSDIPDWVDRKKYITTMRAFAQQLLDDGCLVIFLPFQTGFNKNNDESFIKKHLLPRLHGNVILADDVDITTITSYLQQIDVLVGMRFHSLLLAAGAGTPFLALAYDTKCWRFVTEASYPHALRLEDLTLPTITRAYRSLLANKGAAKNKAKTIADAMFKEADQWKSTRKK